MKTEPRPLSAAQPTWAVPLPFRTMGGSIPALALLLAAAMTLATSCKQKSGPVAPKPPAVQVLTLTTTNAPLTVEFIGQIDSPQNVEVRARVEAFVAGIPFTEGTEVKENDPLFKLDDQPYQERLAAAKGMLGEAQAALKKYETDVARLQPLADKKAVPQQDLDNALAALDVGKANVVSAQARVDSAKLDLTYCDVRAPVTGLIGAKQVSIGSLVGKGDPTLLATISTLDPIWFYCSVSEVDILKADAEAQRTGKRAADAPITLFLADGTEYEEKGHFVFLDRAVDVKTGTMRLRAEFSNPQRKLLAPTNSLTGRPRGGLDRLLRPGMFGRIRLDLGTRADSILVPQRAVQELQGKNFVWVVGEGDQAAQRSVKVGVEIGSDVIVLEGLKAGERLIVEGVQKVRDGLVVKPMTAAQMAEIAAEAAKHAEASHAQAGATKPGKE